MSPHRRKHLASRGQSLRQRVGAGRQSRAAEQQAPAQLQTARAGILSVAWPTGRTRLLQTTRATLSAQVRRLRRLMEQTFRESISAPPCKTARRIAFLGQSVRQRVGAGRWSPSAGWRAATRLQMAQAITLLLHWQTGPTR